MIVFVSNFLNHHQIPLSEELCKLTEGNYRFVELKPMPESFKIAGYPQYDDSPFLIQAWRDQKQAQSLIVKSDVVLYGNISDYYLINRRLNDGKLTFEVGERWFKKGFINVISPRLLRSMWYYYTSFHNKPLYRLCASAYASNDLYKLGMFKSKCFKWGYFTVVRQLDIEKILEARRSVPTVRIITVARFIRFKHHELSVRCIKNLIDNGYNVTLDIYGTGSEFYNISNLINRLNLEDYVFLKGNIPNDDILNEIRYHDIFLFTSDQQEGWGAVVNEAMANACPVIGSDATGAIPFLIRNGENGLIFKSGDINDLTEKVEKLINNTSLREKMARNAYKTICDMWSPANAARRLLILIDSLKSGEYTPFVDGPCSQSIPTILK